MTRARREQISPSDTPYYHCIARCVRRAFLCGEDEFSGQSFEHRRQWIIDRLVQLDQMFAIDICAYALMSNHYHLVLYINQQQAQSWSDDEVIARWTQLFTGPVLIQRYKRGEYQTDAELDKVAEIVAEWRERLMDISWFMRCLNEHIARKANEEDNCKGRFWEGRFKSQALLDEQGLLTCMAYVDLNPVRAAISDCPEASDFTSIQQRIWEYAPEADHTEPSPDKPVLKPFSAEQADSEFAIAFDPADYLELVDWTGRCAREDKRGAISSHFPPILSRLNIDAEQWLKAMQPSGIKPCRAIGHLDKLKSFAKQVGCRWLRESQQFYPLFNRSV
ncbi:transposase [Oceanospirillum sediminis]|uniref:Transposase n=1 Tax=Oceanospirillum sediminis TaxID=2760088 RepID=A0A839IX18_9GAMM|nr:transposase [Oceanospirillum sediminis]MBB1488999.1 transposase [Oceanospirillum sediminis]